MPKHLHGTVASEPLSGLVRVGVVMAKGKKAEGFRNRIVRYDTLPASALQNHEGNWRIHPAAQKEAVEGLLTEIGIVDTLLVYESAEHGGLTVLDGHLRKSLSDEQPWPCAVLDINDDEAALLLATLNPTVSMAEANAERLGRLMERAQSGNAAVQDLISKLAIREGVIPPPEPDNPYEHWQGMPEFVQKDTSGVQKIVVHFETYADVEAFAVLIGQSLTPKTLSIWFPFRERAVLDEVVVSDAS